MQATNPRPYQGYPYLNPPVHDAPSIDSATAARWNNLPRRQMELPVRRTEPVVYVNMPDDPASSTYRPALKRDPADDPVVYIDLPEENGSDVAQSPQNEEPEYVQETIFYDQFENRRIEMNKVESRRRDSESEDDASTISSHSNYRRPLPPIRPAALDLYGAGSSGGASSSNQASSSHGGQSSLMSKEAMLYQGTTDDGFPMSPIPVSEFPEPPPAYNEIDSVRRPAVDPPDPVVEQQRREEPPRTQVILPRDQTTPTPIGLPNADRKYLNCHHCGMRVHTLVIRENGTITHATALMCLIICMIPVIVLIYCTDYFKIKNHYCPNCNKIIGYELPFSNKIVYVN